MANKTRNEKFTIIVDGTTGTGITKRPVIGELDSVHLDYSASMANTCNVTITRKGDAAIPEETMFTVSNNNVDGWYRPRGHVVDDANLPILSAHDKYHVSGYIEASVAQGTDTETVTVTILYEAAQ